MEALVYPGWQQCLFDALVETDRDHQLVRLAQVETAIRIRYEQLHDIDAQDEKQALQDAVQIVRVLKAG